MDDTVKPSLAKSLVAQSKPRIGGRFVSLKEEDYGKEEKNEESGTASETKPKAKRKTKEKEISKEDLIYDTRLLSEEEKEYIGKDALKFYEVALSKARTPAEGHRYASVLVKYQHPSLSAVATKTEVEVTHKVLVWEWDGKDAELEFDPTKTIEGDLDESTEDNNTV